MPEPIPIQLGRGSNKGRHGQEGVASLVNCYVERLGEGGKVEWPIYASNGWDDHATLGSDDTEGVRASISLDALALFVCGNALYSTNEAGTPVTTVGGLPTLDGLVTMARNRRSPNPQVVIVCDGLWFIYEGGSLTQGSDSDLPPPIAVAEIDGFFVFLIQDGRWFFSSIDDTGVDGLDFTEAQASPDRNVMAAVRGRELLIMGEKSIEFYVDNAGSEDFPFTRLQTAAIGCFAGGSVQKVVTAENAADTVVWACTDHKGSFNGIRVLDGYSGKKISTPEVDRLILGEPSPTSIRSMSWTEDGHAFYAISGTSFTKVFDMMFVGNPEAGWHDRKSYGLARWRAQTHCQIGQTHLFGDYATNKIYRSNREALNEAGEPIITEVTCPPVHMFPNPFIMDHLYVDALTGVGVNSATDSDANPELMIDYTDDGGKSFGGERQVDLGAEAQHHVSIREDSFGQFGVNGVSFRFRCSASVVKGLLGASVIARKLGTRAA
jgi:hypothetical protein